MDPQQPGSVLDGKYEILEPLTTGGSSEVYLVRHVHLDEKRIVKVLSPSGAADSSAGRRFLRSAKAATQIKHQNVAILYDYSSLLDGSFYMVWEYVPGQDVGAWMEHNGVFPLEAALDLGIQTLRGLEAIHSTGVIHRDISPDNLIIAKTPSGRALVKIIDLGLAKSFEPQLDPEVTQAGVFLGKLRYCSPEQAQTSDQEALDRRSDLYSFAIVLYEMISGKPPFESDTPHGYVFKRLTEEPLPLVGRSPLVEVPPSLDRVLRRGLAREREDRFPTAIAFIEALEGAYQESMRFSTQRLSVVDQPVPPASSARSASSSSRPRSRPLTAEEKDELLTQINEAAARVRGRRKESPAKRPTPVPPATERPSPPPTEAPTGAPPGGAILAASAPVEARPEPTERPRESPNAEPAQERVEPPALEQEKTAAEPLTFELTSLELPSVELPPLEPPADEPSAAEPAVDEAAAPEPTAPEAPEAGEQASAEETEDARPASDDKVAMTEQMLRRYLDKGQIGLAELGLETLLELAPDHPERDAIRRRIGELKEEAENRTQADEAFVAAREAFHSGDLRVARKQLGRLERLEPGSERSARLASLLAESEERQGRAVRAEKQKKRFETALRRGRFGDAEAALDELAEVGTPKLVLDEYRRQLEMAQSGIAEKSRLREFEEWLRLAIKSDDWPGAREVALQAAAALPDSRRPAEMFAEIARLEKEAEQRRAIEQGVAQIEAFIADGDGTSAATALQVLLRLAPKHPKRRQLEKKIKQL